MITRKEYLKAVANVARRAGVSTIDVETSYRKCLKKAAASIRDLFLGDSVITLRPKKVDRRSAVARLPRGRLVVAHGVARKGKEV